ncbi:MAG: DNA topoisomerase IV subunit B, partial [Bartonella sp.]|nr:DNA topoisomerase IV subunit B [Bartonella sp.]
RDENHKDELLKTEFTGKAKIEIGRFKGLGEMRAEQLKETTMHPQKRTLLRIAIDAVDMQETKNTVESLMGTKPEARFRFIQENSTFADNLDI